MAGRFVVCRKLGAAARQHAKAHRHNVRQLGGNAIGAHRALSEAEHRRRLGGAEVVRLLEFNEVGPCQRALFVR
jgi:hypothetical protein